MGRSAATQRNAREDTPDMLASRMTERIAEACDESAPPRTQHGGRPRVHWWCEETAEARQRCVAAKRRLQRSKRHPANAATQQQRKEEYKNEKKQMRLAIRKAKDEGWGKMIASIEVDPWGMPYKLCMGKLAPSQVHHVEVVREAVEKLFPEGEQLPAPDPRPAQERELDPPQGPELPGGDEDDNEAIPGVSAVEVKAAIKKAKNGKAPGPENVPNEVVKLAYSCDPEAFVKLYGTCMKEGVFPRQWKEARLVLLPKGSDQQQRSFRPLCLLNSTAKVFEKIVATRLERYLDENEGISENQYGFRRGKLTTDAILDRHGRIRDRTEGGKKCVAIALDIKNAFNTASWPQIAGALRAKNAPRHIQRIVESYLTDRSLYHDTPEDRVTKRITRGVSQGSVLGPLLWNVMFNGVLETRMPGGATTMCYADDTIILATGDNIREARDKAAEAAERAIRWIERADLEVARHKTEAIAFGRGGLQPDVKREGITIGGAKIEWSSSIKYLGVKLDRRLSYIEHVGYAAGRAESATKMLARLMPNVGGPRQARRRLLGRVSESIMLYAAPAWAKAMETTRGRDTANAAQRKATRQEICAYRTISKKAATVIAGTPPMHLLGDERARIWTRRRETTGAPDARTLMRRAWTEERAVTMRKWQTEWNATSKGEWTRALIPDLLKWCKKKGEVSFQLTQALGGDGCFNAYLHRFGKRTNSRCHHCGRNDDAEHAIFECEEGRDIRENDLRDTAGNTLGPTTLVNEMLTRRDAWNRVKRAVESIIRRKEKTERRQEARRRRDAD